MTAGRIFITGASSGIGAAGRAAAVADFAAIGGGRLDVVFTNAGVLFMGNHEEISAENKALLIDTNIKGVIPKLMGL